MTNTFDRQSAIETILYLASHSKKPTFHRISKLLYFADRDHLSRYGRLICGDHYVAMKHGPVPSGVYDILKYIQGTGTNAFPEAKDAFTIHDIYRVVALRQPDLEWLSDSDIECLDRSIAEYGEKSFDELTDISHATVAWQEADLNDFIGYNLLAKDVDDAHGLDGLLTEHVLDPTP